MASGEILGVGAPLAAPSAYRASPAPTRPASFPGRISGFETVSESSGHFRRSLWDQNNLEKVAANFAPAEQRKQSI